MLGLLKKEATNLLIVARLSVEAKGLNRYEALFEGKPLSVKSVVSSRRNSSSY